MEAIRAIETAIRPAPEASIDAREIPARVQLCNCRARWMDGIIFQWRVVPTEEAACAMAMTEVIIELWNHTVAPFTEWPHLKLPHHALMAGETPVSFESRTLGNYLVQVLHALIHELRPQDWPPVAFAKAPLEDQACVFMSHNAMPKLLCQCFASCECTLQMILGLRCRNGADDRERLP